jgi:hypothetical protein
MAGVGGAADLVVDHDHRAAALPEAQHRLDEVASVRAEEPGGANDEALPVDQRGCPLPRELGAAVRVDRIGIVGLAVGPALTGEDVVGRRIDDLGVHLRGGVGDEPGALRVDQRRVGLRLLGPVDVGPGRAVDHRAGALAGDDALDPGGVRDVEVVVRESDHLVAHVLGDPDDIVAEHPVRAGDQDPHGIEMSALSPTRKRSVFGIPSLRERLTFLPSRLASIRACRLRMLEPASTIECSISESLITTSRSIAV